MAGICVVRARRNSVWLAAFLLSLFGSELGAQVTPQDSLPPDTVVVPVPPDPADTDTIPEALREAAQSVARGPILPTFPAVPAGSWSTGTWVLSREELALQPGLTLLEVVERFPGVARFRAGGYGRPEAVTALGLGGARVRVIVDGREMDPVGFDAFPLEALPLQDIERLEIRRSLDGIEIDVTTFRLDQDLPHSQVELGTGVYQTRVLRALFSRGFGDNSIATGAFDLASTRGIGLNEPYSNSTALARYEYAIRENWGLRAEWRGLRIDRQGTVFPQQTTRSDLSVATRMAPSERTRLELIVASATQQEEDSTTGAYDVRMNQVTARAALLHPSLTAEVRATGRTLSGEYPQLARGEIDSRVEWRPVGAFALAGHGAVQASTGHGAASAGVTATLAPIPSLRLFAGAAIGSRLVSSALDSAAAVPEGEEPEVSAFFDVVSRSEASVRTGAELALDFGSLGAAVFRNDLDPRGPFGLAFDRGLPLVTDLAPVQGVETFFDLGVPGTAGTLRLEGNYSRIFGDIEVPYVPTETGRIGLWFHDLFYGGQLEPSARAEAVYRGNAIVPPLEDAESYSEIAGGYPAIQFSLDIRILDVQAFLLWTNALYEQSAIDFPGAPRPFPRIVYGAKWRFRN